MQHEVLFSLAAKAAARNPFSEERDSLDHAIIGRPIGSLSRGAVLQALVVTLSNAFAAIVDKGTTLSPGTPAPQRHAFLFFLFHQSLADIDSVLLMEKDSEVSTRRATLQRAKTPQALYERLRLHGSPPAEAAHFVSTFFQMRKAFLNIESFLPGKGSSMRVLREGVWNALFTARLDLLETKLSSRLRDFPILMLGETGTGKSSAARALGESHYVPFSPELGAFRTPHFDAFVPVNINALTESLFEAELFGYRKGAFTGAVESHEGLLSRLGPHSSLFLDEIGDLPERLQVKLLEVLQERRFRQLGSTEAKTFEGRILAATHRNPATLLSTGKMREDFFYRICALKLEFPSLRIRLEEDPDAMRMLVSQTLRRTLGDEVDPSLAEEVVANIEKECPRNYAWPGNVRELEQVVRRWLLTRTVGTAFESEHAPALGPLLSTPIQMLGSKIPSKSSSEHAPHHDFSAFVQAACAAGMPLKALSAAVARKYLEQEGTLEKAARKAGIDWRTLKRLVES
jgi:DNA-binding NtrC family response regulator